MCLNCESLCCRQCFAKYHRGVYRDCEPGEPAKEHECEVIEDFQNRIKQTVWMINSKLDKSIQKMRFLIAELILVGGLEAKVKSEKDSKNIVKKEGEVDPNDITLEYVLEMSIQSRQHSEQAF
jgi:hypothetical protein